jgi:hypothetical protein
MPIVNLWNLAILFAISLLLVPSASAQVQDDRHDAYAQAHISWSVYHEAGHAIQDFIGTFNTLSKSEREIDADMIAAYLLLPATEDPAEYGFYYDAAMDLYFDPDPPDPNHIYETGRQRAERMFCLLYGARPNSQYTEVAQRLKNRSDVNCVADYNRFKENAEDVLGFALEVTALEDPSFILPRYMPATEKDNDAYQYLQETEILDDLAIDVEQWLPALQVAEKPFQIVAQDCKGYDGFWYEPGQSAVIACYAAVQRCMKRPGHLLPPEYTFDEGSREDESSWDEDGAGDDSSWDQE